MMEPENRIKGRVVHVIHVATALSPGDNVDAVVCTLEAVMGRRVSSTRAASFSTYLDKLSGGHEKVVYSVTERDAVLVHD